MRRATQTALFAFEPHMVAAKLPTFAHEACHETGGAHTCDKRLPKLDLEALYPMVDYSLIGADEDPLWGDGECAQRTIFLPD
jgi:hypothetical protein